MQTVSRLAYTLEIGNSIGIVVEKNDMGFHVVGGHQRYEVPQ